MNYPYRIAFVFGLLVAAASGCSNGKKSVSTDAETETTDPDTNPPADPDINPPSDLSECYQGHYFIESVADIEAISSYPCVNGNLEIFGDWTDFNTDLTNLSGLENLKYIFGNLEIRFTENLNDLFGLKNVQVVEGRVLFRGNNALTDFGGLAGLTRVGSLYVWSNDALTSFDGLSHLTRIDSDLSVSNNPQLGSFSGLNHLAYVATSVTIVDCGQLLNFEGLNSLEEIGGSFLVGGNASILDFSGLEKLSTIEENLVVGGSPHLTNMVGNDALSSLEGLDSLQVVGGYASVALNTNLPDCELCALAKQLDDGPKLVLGYTQNKADSCTNACPDQNICYRGDIVAISDEDFAPLEPFECIAGSITVKNTSLMNLKRLSNLSYIGGDLNIVGNNTLSDISGLANISQIKGVVDFSDNQMIRSLAALGNLTGAVESLYLYKLPYLEDLEGLERITRINRLLGIAGNDRLVSLDGLDNLTYIGLEVHIGTVDNEGKLAGNPLLENIAALGNVSYIGDNIHIEHNDSLKNLQGLEKLTRTRGPFFDITNNASLETLDGLNNLESVAGWLSIRANNSLVNLQGLDNLRHVHWGMQVGGEAGSGVSEPGNDKISSLDGAPLLEYVGYYLRIFDNDSLPECEVDNWVTQLKVSNFLELSPNGDIDPQLCGQK